MRRVVLLAALLIVLVGVAVRRTLDPPLTISASQTPVRMERIAEGLEHPWGLAFLPDGRMLVTERLGRLRIVSQDGMVSPPLAGVPAVHAHGRGGLLDVSVAPDFASSHLIYLTDAANGAILRLSPGER